MLDVLERWELLYAFSGSGVSHVSEPEKLSFAAGFTLIRGLTTNYLLMGSRTWKHVSPGRESKRRSP